MLRSIPATLMRGGTSKGLYFDARDLPPDAPTRDAVLLAALGSPDSRQIDGVGGAHPLTSKVAVIARSSLSGVDVDYLFLQVAVDAPRVSDSQTCGNLLAGVGPWAIEQGLVTAQRGVTPVRIHMVNTKSRAVAHVPTPEGRVEYAGQTHIDGVPGTAAGIALEVLDVAGSSCGALLPTGRALDVVQGISVTCVDNGMPVVLLRAADLGLTGHETPEELESRVEVRERIEKIRLEIGPRMHLGDVAHQTVPKMTLLAPPRAGGLVATRSFIPHRVHEAIGVLGALSVATGCVLPGSVAEGVARLPDGGSAGRLDVEHPTGSFSVEVDLRFDGSQVEVRRAALLRTARKLMQGEVYVPSSAWGAG